MIIKQVKTNVIVNDIQSNGTLRLEDHLPMFEELHEELLPAIDLKKIAKENLPPGMKFDWSDMSYQEKVAGEPVKIGNIEIPVMAVIIPRIAVAARIPSK